MRVAKISIAIIVLLLPLVGLVIATGGGLGNQETARSDLPSEFLLTELNAEPLNRRLLNANVVLRDLHGNKIHLRDFIGKVVLLSFWATWCPSCKLEMPSMEALHSALNQEGLVVLAVNFRESAHEVKAFFEEHQLSFPALLDENGDLFERFSVWSLPTTFIIGKKGDVVGKVIGYRDWHSAQTMGALRALLDDTS